jgi:hypothetical protein
VAEQALEQLRDIHLPDAIGWWPLAFGWYLLAFIILLLVTLGISYGYRWHRGNRAKREALRHLTNYEQQYLQTKNARLVSAQISELLKRVALVYFPRMRVAGLSGKAWIDFLNDTAKDIDFHELAVCLIELPYQSEVLQIDISPLFVNAKAWIKQRGTPCLS